MQALVKWPNVPHAYGWLGLDQRGQWYLRNSATQALGAFASGVPNAKGALIEHEKLIAFIARNYESDADGQWFFQNGPQRVYVELEAAPLVWRIVDETGGGPLLVSHTDRAAHAHACMVDETGRLYLDSDLGFGIVHSLYVAQAADLIDNGTWNTPEPLSAAELPARFGYVASPLARKAEASGPQR